MRARCCRGHVYLSRQTPTRLWMESRRSTLASGGRKRRFTRGPRTHRHPLRVSCGMTPTLSLALWLAPRRCSTKIAAASSSSRTHSAKVSFAWTRTLANRCGPTTCPQPTRRVRPRLAVTSSSCMWATGWPIFTRSERVPASWPGTSPTSRRPPPCRSTSTQRPSCIRTARSCTLPLCTSSTRSTAPPAPSDGTSVPTAGPT
mmetsp:Transcript_5751/g.14625  ORF Transcript_5751/g.14625 Transcript_5751/m.14625 type:complete len:202 (+) Transcript_5751:192-797(+)